MLVEALSLEVSDISSEGTLEILYSGVCSTFSLSKLPRSYSKIALNASMIGAKIFFTVLKFRYILSVNKRTGARRRHSAPLGVSLSESLAVPVSLSTQHVARVTDVHRHATGDVVHDRYHAVWRVF